MTRVFDRCCLTGGRGHEQGRSAVGNRLALRVRAAICARVSLGATASAPAKSHPAALASPIPAALTAISPLHSRKRRWRACPPLVRRAHRRARSHASRLPGNFATRSRSPKRLTQDPRPARRQDHETSRGQRIRGRRAWVRGPRIPGWPRFRRPRRQGRQRRLRRRTSGYGRGCVPLFLLRFPRARLDRSADASSDAPLIPARRNCWFTLDSSGGARVKSAPPFPRSRLH